MWSRGRARGRGQHMRQRGHPSRGSFTGRISHSNFRGSFHNKHSSPYIKPYADKLARPPPPKPGHEERLSENDIGIMEYVSTLKGFKGLLKARYSDFQVNEIDKDGKIAKLTDLSVPVDPEPEPVEEDDEGVVNRYRIEQLPIETWDKLHKIVQSSDLNECVEIDVTETSKSDRTKIHEAVKTVFGPKIVGTTISKDDKKFITFKKFNKHDKIDLREKWPSTRAGEYVYFLVHKEFTDTIEANLKISDCLQMRSSNFCYAGVKDRRAKTTQWFCVRKLEPSKIVDRTKNLRNIYIGNFCYKTETLKLGQLKGNRFRIAVREITASEEHIKNALESLRDNGFINYYGLQRFGNCKEIPTYTIGLELLRGNWSQAVNLILKPRKYEQFNDVAAAKRHYQKTKDPVQALAKVKKIRNKCVEGKLLQGLTKHGPNDYVNALENIARNLRLLYIHAYQSLVWNEMTSRRIKEFGLKPVVGDLVVDDPETNPTWESIETDGADKYEPDIEAQKEMKPQHVKVKCLSESDVHKYTIYDIVMPLPGYDITYPDNIMKQWYKEYLEKDGLSLEMPKQKVKTYTLSGAYRKIVERCTNMSWKFMKYDDPVQDLIRSDIEEWRGSPEPKSLANGKYKALIIDFCLSSSCYATMALRELMKINTYWDGVKSATPDTEVKNKNDTQTSSDQAGSTSKTNENEKVTVNSNSSKYEPDKPTSENDSISSEPNVDKKDSVNVTNKNVSSNGESTTLSDKKLDAIGISEKVESKNESDVEVTGVTVIKVKEERMEDDPDVQVTGITVVTPEEIQEAKKEYIKKEIEELEDEIWSVMEDETKDLKSSKRKVVNKTPVDAKKSKIISDISSMI